MIFSSVYADTQIGIYPRAIQQALAYLKSQDFTRMETGVYEIQGREIYAQVMDAVTGPVEEKKPEVHRNYVDVQFLASGRERLGFTPDTGAYPVAEAHPDRDLYFYDRVENEGFIEATPGCFCVFFPWDVHRPAVMKDEPLTIRKVVVKVAVSLLTPCQCAGEEKEIL